MQSGSLVLLHVVSVRLFALVSGHYPGASRRLYSDVSAWIVVVADQNFETHTFAPELNTAISKSNQFLTSSFDGLTGLT